MIMAEVNGLHVPRWIANGEFAVQPYIVMELHRRSDAAQDVRRSSRPGGRDRANRHRGGCRPRRPAPAARAAPRSETGQYHVSSDRRGRADRLRPVASRAASRSAGGTVPSANGDARLYGAGAAFQGSIRQAQRHLRVRRRPLPARHRSPPVWTPDTHAQGTPARMARPRPPSNPAAETPARLQEIILRCLEPLPDARYAERHRSSLRLAPSGSRRADRTRRAHAAERLQDGSRPPAARRKNDPHDPRQCDQAAATPTDHIDGRRSARGPRRVEAKPARSRRVGVGKHAGCAARLRQRHVDAAYRSRGECRCSGGEHPCAEAGRIEKLGAASAAAAGQDLVPSSGVAQHCGRSSRVRTLQPRRSHRHRCAGTRTIRRARSPPKSRPKRPVP